MHLDGSIMAGKLNAKDQGVYKAEGWGKARGMAFNNCKTQVVRIL